MKKRTRFLLSVLLLTLACLGLLSACNTNSNKADYFTYSEDNLGVMGKLVYWMHRWIGNYGWTVVVFTLFLKLIMTPLDIWQRVSTKKMTLKTQKMQPLMAEIDRRYGANTQRANEEKQKLYKKEGYSMFSTCLPMIISMVIFFVMFGGLRNYSTYSSVMNFQELSGTYYDAYYQAVKADAEATGDYTKFDALNSAIKLPEDVDVSALTNEHFLRENYTEANVNAYDTAIYTCRTSQTATDSEGNVTTAPAAFTAEEHAAFQQTALEKVSDYYVENHESWLWLQNVWQPDTWATIMPAYSDSNNGFSSSVDMSDFGRDEGVSHYNIIRDEILKTGIRGNNGAWNGLMILPILSVALSFLSIFISQKTEKKNRKEEPAQPMTEQQTQQAASNKMLMFLMPAMMAIFGFMYTGAFAIYMVANYALSILSTLALRVPVDKIVEKSIEKADKTNNGKGGKADYMR